MTYHPFDDDHGRGDYDPDDDRRTGYCSDCGNDTRASFAVYFQQMMVLDPEAVKEKSHE